MLIEVKELVGLWKIQPNGILHVGAHEGEEYETYCQAGWVTSEKRVTWVEIQHDLVSKLQKKLPRDLNTILEGAIWDRDGISLNLQLANNSQATSLLGFGTHSETYPEISVIREENVITTRLDSLLNNNQTFDFVNLDIQGAELKALVGMGKMIDNVNWVYTEVNKRSVYEGCALVGEMDDFLLQHGFKRGATKWMRGAGYGDALYVRIRDLNGNVILKNRIFVFRKLLSWLLRTSQLTNRMGKKVMRALKIT